MAERAGATRATRWIAQEPREVRHGRVARGLEVHLCRERWTGVDRRTQAHAGVGHPDDRTGEPVVVDGDEIEAAVSVCLRRVAVSASSQISIRRRTCGMLRPVVRTAPTGGGV